MIPAANLRFMWDNINARIGTPYVWGGTLNPDDPTQGTDCSGAVGFVIEALLSGPAMNWDRPFWTGSFAGMTPGQVAQPWGLVCIARPQDAPPDAAAIVAINQGPTADTSHMIVRVLDRTIDPEGVDIEDDGEGLQKLDRAANITDAQFNQWFYLPGPLEQPMSQRDLYAVAIIREGQRRNISPRGIMIALSVPFVESGWKMYANSNVPESLAYPHDAVGSDHDSTGLFQQRQAWGPLSCTMDAACSAGLFFDGGDGGQRGLTDFDYNDESRSPGSYAQAVQVSAYPDRYDLYWHEAVDLYNRLAGAAPIPPTAEGFLMALNEQEQRELLDRIRQLSGLYDVNPSKSRYGDARVWNSHDFIRNIDGHVYDLIVEHNAALGDPWSLSAVQTAAARGDQIALNFLARLTTPPSTTPTPPPAVTPPPAPPPTPPQPQPIPNLPAHNGNGDPTTGALIGRAYDALDALRLADALPIEGRAPLAALIAVLQTKNGSQLGAP